MLALAAASLGWQELAVHLRLVRKRSQAASHQHLEPLDAVPGARHGTDVVHAAESAGMAFAAGIGNLELAPEVLRIRMTQHEVRHGVSVGHDVERFVAAYARVGAARDVAHNVAASLARCDSDGRKPPHEVRRVIDVDEVALDILPRRHMEHSDRVLLRNIGQGSQLVRAHPPHRDLDPLHLDPVLALSIDTVTQPELRENLLIDLARLQSQQFGSKISISLRMSGGRCPQPALYPHVYVLQQTCSGYANSILAILATALSAMQAAPREGRQPCSNTVLSVLRM